MGFLREIHHVIYHWWTFALCYIVLKFSFHWYNTYTWYLVICVFICLSSRCPLIIWCYLTFDIINCTLFSFSAQYIGVFITLVFLLISSTIQLWRLLFSLGLYLGYIYVSSAAFFLITDVKIWQTHPSLINCFDKVGLLYLSLTKSICQASYDNTKHKNTPCLFFYVWHSSPGRM